MISQSRNTIGAKQVQKGAPILEAEQRIWKQYSDIEFDTDNFAEIGIAFEQQGHVRLSQIGKAICS